MRRRFRVLPGLAALAAASVLGAAHCGETVPAVEKGKPFPGGPQTIPYEEVLDHCDLALAGEIKDLGDGSVALEVESVLKGEYKEKTARLSFEGSWNTTEVDGLKAPEAGEKGTFLCVRGADGALLLAGNPPKGGGFVEEGPELVRKMLEAARDPAKGFESKDAAVRLSSAYRLARKWLAAPAEARPKLPAGIMDVLMQGLLPGDLAGRHVNAGARNCINDMLKCNIIANWKYSVNHESGRRELYGKQIVAAWERTAKAVRAQRAGQPDPEPPAKVNAGEAAKRPAELVAQLGADAYDRREAADRALREIGKDAAEALRAGAASKDAEVAERCQELLNALENASKRPPDQEKARFDMEVAGPFVSDAPPPSAPTPGN